MTISMATHAGPTAMFNRLIRMLKLEHFNRDAEEEICLNGL